MVLSPSPPHAGLESTGVHFVHLRSDIDGSNVNYNPGARPSNPSANKDSPEYTLRDGSRIVFPLYLDELASDDSDREDSPYHEYSTSEESYGRRGRQMERNGQ